MPTTSAAIVVREHLGKPFYEAKWRHDGQQVLRRIGPAWLERDSDSDAWRRRSGRLTEVFYDEARAHVAAAQLVAVYTFGAAERERSTSVARVA